MVISFSCFVLKASSNVQNVASKNKWETKNDPTMNILSNDAAINTHHNTATDVPKTSSFSSGAISQHINRLHQKAQLVQSQEKSTTTTSNLNSSNMMCSTSSHTNLSSSQMASSLQQQHNIDPFSPSPNMTQQQNDLSMQHSSLHHRGIGRPQTNDQAGNSRRASDPVRVLDGKTYHVTGHHVTQSSRQRSGSYNHLNHSSSSTNNTNYDHGTSYNSSNHQNIDVTSNRHVRAR